MLAEQLVATPVGSKSGEFLLVKTSLTMLSRDGPLPFDREHMAPAQRYRADAASVGPSLDGFDLGADLCTPHEENPKWPPLRMTQAQVDRLEAEIDAMNASINPEIPMLNQ